MATPNGACMWLQQALVTLLSGKEGLKDGWMDF